MATFVMSNAQKYSNTQVEVLTASASRLWVSSITINIVMHIKRTVKGKRSLSATIKIQRNNSEWF